MTTAVKTLSAIALLKADHKKVKDLFDQFEKAEKTAQKQKIAEEAMKELRVHAAIEEEIFYPEVREALGNDGKDLLDEADEEHRVAKTIIEQLSGDFTSDDHWEAKFLVLAENVRHHIKEEENELLPEAKDADVDMDMLGEKLTSRKEELMDDESALETAEQRTRVKPYQKLA